MLRTTLLVLCSSFAAIDAFPTLATRGLEGLAPNALNHVIETVEKYRTDKRFILDTSKPISVSGKHAFQAPGEKDQRGPCPGLNALANHNYISHDGITSSAEVITAINKGSSQVKKLRLYDSADTGVKCMAWVST
jgi:hypothetical protein